MEGAEAASPNGLLNVGILKHHQGGVATQFKVHPLQQPSRYPRHLPAGSHRARKGDHRNIRVDDEFTSDVSATGENVEDIWLKTRLLEQAREDDTAADRRPRIRLQHNRVADSQCGSDPRSEHEER